MIPRYTPPYFQELFSQQHKYNTWLKVELAACEAMERHGTVPEGTATRIRNANKPIDANRIDEIELTTKHDVIAFLTHMEELYGVDARHLHVGMTSSDVLDTSLALIFRESLLWMEEKSKVLLEQFSKKISQHAATPIIGRSHGIHAEPTTFGVVLAGHATEMARNHLRLRDAICTISVGKIAGAVGTYAHLKPDIESRTLLSLGLRPETVATQIVSRDRHAHMMNALALYAASIERFATNVRHWQRTEVREAEEAFTQGQKGSSAMPHKRNPVLSENLCGLARVVRAASLAAQENVALWHERDISHSSVERTLITDAIITMAFMIERCTKLIEGLVVYPERMMQNLNSAKGLWASEGLLLALTQKGLMRQEAYVLVQRNAMKAFFDEGNFETLLASDPEIKLSSEEIQTHFDLKHALKHCPEIVARAIKEIEVSMA